MTDTGVGRTPASSVTHGFHACVPEIKPLPSDIDGIIVIVRCDSATRSITTLNTRIGRY